MSAGVFLGIALALFLLPLLAESVTSWIAIQIARQRHPLLWEHSGRPTLWGNSTLPQAWPLVRYYRDRGWLRKSRPPRDAPGDIERGRNWYPPIIDPASLTFAEKLRLPLIVSYWAAWFGVAASVLFLLIGGVILF